jgi:mannosyltransferase OCH1-like enzyme
MIPKKIHYCWFGPNSFSSTIQKCIRSWYEKMPGYEVCLWNESNSPMDIPFVRDAYNAGKYAFVSDYVRFWALYNHGGIYFDTDVFVIKDCTDLLKEEVFFAWESNILGTIGCGIIGSTKNHPFIGAILENYNSLEFSVKMIPQLVIPGIVTKCYDSYFEKKRISIFPFTYFYPFPYQEKENARNFRRYIKKDTYAVHLWEVSWGTRYAKLKDFLIYYLKLFNTKVKK